MTEREKNKIPFGMFSAVTIGLVVCAFFLLVYRPLLSKTRAIRRLTWEIKHENQLIRNFLRSYDELDIDYSLLLPDEVSFAIDEMTQIGSGLEIDFISIKTGDIKDSQEMAYQRLPIVMELQSRYRNLGIFLSALHDLKGCTVVIRRFAIQRDDKKVPLIKSRLEMDVYIQEGKNG